MHHKKVASPPVQESLGSRGELSAGVVRILIWCPLLLVTGWYSRKISPPPSPPPSHFPRASKLRDRRASDFSEHFSGSRTMERKCLWNFTQPHSENTSAQTSPLISGEGCISDYGVTIVCPSASVHSVHHSLSLHKKKKQWARESALLWAVPRVPCGLSRSPFWVSLRQGYLAIRIHMYLLSQIHSTKGRLACPKDSNGPREMIRVRCYCLHRSRSILSSESRPFGVFSCGTRGGKETADTHRFRFLASAAVSAVAASLGRTAACRPRASSEVGRTFSRTTELPSGAA